MELTEILTKLSEANTLSLAAVEIMEALHNDDSFEAKEHLANIIYLLHEHLEATNTKAMGATEFILM